MNKFNQKTLDQAVDKILKLRNVPTAKSIKKNRQKKKFTRQKICNFMEDKK